MEYIDRRKQQIQRAIREEREQEHWNEVHNQLLAIQKKSLEVSNPNDADEKEADEVARKVMSGESAEIHGTGGTINRSGEGVQETTPEFQTKLESSKGGGQSLDDSTKSEMGSKMGADFSAVKIHTGSEANAMNESVNAKAFTHGQDIYFNSSHSPENKELLAHELVHTVQQRNHSSNLDRKIFRSGGPIENPDPDVMYEEKYVNEKGTDAYPGKLNDAYVIYYYFSPESKKQIPTVKTAHKSSVLDAFPKTPNLKEPVILNYRTIGITTDSGFNVRFDVAGWSRVEEGFDPVKYKQDVSAFDYTLRGFDENYDYSACSMALTGSAPGGGKINWKGSFSASEGLHQLLSNYGPPLLVNASLTPLSLYYLVVDWLALNYPQYSSLLGGKARKLVLHSFKSLEDAQSKTRLEDYNYIIFKKSESQYYTADLSEYETAKISSELAKPAAERSMGTIFPELEKMEIVGFKFLYGPDEEALSKEEVGTYHYKTDYASLLATVVASEKEGIIVKEKRGNYYSFMPLSHSGAVEHWNGFESGNHNVSEYDKVLNQGDYQVWMGPRITAVLARGESSTLYVIDRDYLRGRDIFRNNIGDLQSDDSYSIDENNPVSKFFSTETPEALLAKKYIDAMLDRDLQNTSSAYPLLSGRRTLNRNLGQYIYLQLQKEADVMAIDILDKCHNAYTAIKMSSDLASYVMIFPLMSPEGQKQTLDLWGIDEDDQQTYITTLSDSKKADDIAYGGIIDDISLDVIFEKTREADKNILDAKSQIQAGEVHALHMQNTLGNEIRTVLYKKRGFKNISPIGEDFVGYAFNGYPHRYMDGGVGALNSGRTDWVTNHDFSNMAELLYAGAASANIYMEEFKGNLLWTLNIIAAAAIIIVSEGLATPFALLLFGEGIAASIAGWIIGAGIMTLLGGGLAKLQGQEYDIWHAFIVNLLTLGVFKLIGFRTPLRVTITTTAFIGIVVGDFYYINKRLPTLEEMGGIVFENLLVMAMIGAGMKLTTPISAKFKAWALNTRFKFEFTKLIRDITYSQKLLAELNLADSTSRAKVSTKAKLKLIKNQKSLLIRYRDLLIKMKIDKLTPPEGMVFEDEIISVNEQIKELQSAETQTIANLRPIATTRSVATYKPGAESIDALKAQYGEENVKVVGEGKDQVVIITEGGQTFTLVPEGGVANGTGLQSALFGNESFGNNLRRIATDIIAFEPTSLEAIRKYFGDGWKELSKDVYQGEKNINGKISKQIFISENAINITETAIQAETLNPGKGAGMEVIKNSLRSTAAEKGLDNYLKNEGAGKTPAEQLDDLMKMEEAAKEKNKSLNEVLEERVKVKVDPVRAEFDAIGPEWIKFNPFTGLEMFFEEAGGYVVAHTKHNNIYRHEFTMAEAFAADGYKVELLNEQKAQGESTPDADIKGEGIFDFKNIEPTKQTKNITKGVEDNVLECGSAKENLALNLGDNPNVLIEMVNEGIQNAINAAEFSQISLPEKVGVVYPNGKTKIITIEQFKNGERF